MKEFAFKKDAINFLNKSNNNKLVLFQEDKDANNSKKFIVATNNEIYTIHTTQTHFKMFK